MTDRILPSLHDLDWTDLPVVTAAVEKAFADLTEECWGLVAGLLAILGRPVGRPPPRLAVRIQPM